MADVTVDRLIVLIEAQTRSFEAQLRKIEGQVAGSTSRMSGNFGTLSRQIGRAGEEFIKFAGGPLRAGILLAIPVMLARSAMNVKQLEEEARKAGATFDENFVKKADAFYESWGKRIYAWELLFKASITSIAMELGQLIEEVTGPLEKIDEWLRENTGKGFFMTPLRDMLKMSATPPSAQETATAPKTDFYTQYLAKLKQEIELQRVKNSLFGRSAGTLEFYVKQQEMLNYMSEHHIKITGDQVHAVDALIAALVKQDEEAKKLQLAQEQLASAAHGVADSFQDAFHSILDDVNNTSQAIIDMLKSLEKSILDSILFGSGPFAGIMGNAGQNGMPGGLFGGLFDWLKNFNWGSFGGSGGGGFFGGSSGAAPAMAPAGGVTVHNYGNAQVQAQPRPGGGVEVLIDQHMKRTLRDSYGISPKRTGRT
jgi:hypothetical protein